MIANVLGRSIADGNKQIDSLLARYPNDSNLHAAAGAVLARAGDSSRGTALLSQAVSLDTRNFDARVALASLYERSEKPQEAEQQLQAVIAADPKHVAAYIGLAKLAVRSGHRDQAAKYLEQAIGAQPASVDARLLLAQLALTDRDIVRANSLIEQAVAASKNSPIVANTVGVLLSQAAQYERALQYFEQAAATGDAEAKLNAARVQITVGKKNDARNRLGSLADAAATRVAAVTLLARLDVEDGKVDAAVDRIEALRKSGVKAPVVDELLGDIFISAKQADKAAQSYEKAYLAAPSGPLATKRFQALVQQRDPKAGSVLSAWLSKEPDNLLIRKLLAKYLLTTGDYAAAAREHETWFAKSHVRDPEMLNDLAWMYGELHDSRGLSLAREAHLARPESAEIADTYGWLLVSAQDLETALPILEKAAHTAQANPEIQYHYAAALLHAGKRTQAQTVLKATLDQHKQFPSRDAANRLLQSIN